MNKKEVTIWYRWKSLVIQYGEKITLINWRKKIMNKIFSWLYHLLFGGLKCDCCKKYVRATLSQCNKNNQYVSMCYKCTCIHDALNPTMKEIYEEFESVK